MFTAAFLIALLISLTLRIGLALRQSRHVGNRRNAVPADFAGEVSLPEHQKAADYTQAKIRLSLAALAGDTALLLVLTLGGLLQWMSEFWLSVLGATGYAYGLLLFASVGIVGLTVDLPFSLYRVFAIEARFGFNKLTMRLFFSDLVKQLLLAIAIGGPVLLAVLWLMAAMGERWWLYVWLFWLGFNLLAMQLYPTVIAPIFNTFRMLDEGVLKNRIEALLSRCGFTSSGLFVMDGSKRSAHGNAYFTGFGKSKRIVFFDTLIQKLTPSEVEAVLAHELGHFRLKHVWKRIGVMSVISLVLLSLLGSVLNETWFYQGLGVTSPETTMALILFAQVLPIFLFPLTPLASGLSRRHEYQADAYAARWANSHDLVTALLKLYRDNAATLTPDPWHSLFYDSHPPASLRIAKLKQASGPAS